MKIKTCIGIVLTLAVMLLSASCSTTSKLKEGEVLYTGV